MQLIGMLDCPYVRRTAISLQLLGIPFEHRSLSVFSTFDQFRQVNPVVKAPTLICDDGTVLMESTLILEYAERIAVPGKSRVPANIAQRMHGLRLTGLALAACEKSVQIIYERNLRPAEKLHAPWVERVTGQLFAAYDALEAELGRVPPAVERGTIDHAGVAVAVAWQFTQMMLPEVVDAARYPRLAKFSAQAEQLPEFVAAPHGTGTYKAAA